MMAVVPVDRSTVGGTDNELYGKDFEEAYNDSFAPKAQAPRLRDLWPRSTA